MNKDKMWVWVEKYRPDTIQDCILPDNLKTLFQSYVNDKNIPSMTLVGTTGSGKTSSAIAMLNEIDADWIKTNSSLKRGLDVIRTEIMDFASSMSFKEGRKYVILDEADGMIKGAQEGLKSFMEEYASNCGFILTCNSKDRIIPEILSRCPPVYFTFDKENFPKYANQFLSSVENILTLENVEYDKKVLAILIKKHYPDFRRILGELQNYSMKYKKIDTGILSFSSEENLSELIQLLKNKNWTEMRKWVAENPKDYNILSRRLYDQIKDKVMTNSLPAYIILHNTYDYQQAFVIDKEINTVAFLTEVMQQMVWK
jgi:DNA polymerase III delta prime subunit